MIKPTKTNQEQWIKKHLNGGKCPKSKIEWYQLCSKNVNIACFKALQWLHEAKPDITTLAKAWERCPRGDWLAWTFPTMQPDKSDLPKFNKLLQLLDQAFPVSREDHAWDRSDVKRACEYERPLPTAEAMDYYITDLVEDSADTETDNKVIADLIRKAFGNPWREKNDKTDEEKSKIVGKEIS